MLCETIHLYRLKQMLAEEEMLYFLLIDILRSPQIFKAICGDSIKDIKPMKPVQIKQNSVVKKTMTMSGVKVKTE
jgi:hypothetical protein